ncbi:hypothetical protein [Salmon gill poxvirus]|nr:hypothetical protein [Salmon gill poxvirus]
MMELFHELMKYVPSVFLTKHKLHQLENVSGLLITSNDCWENELITRLYSNAEIEHTTMRISPNTMRLFDGIGPNNKNMLILKLSDTDDISSLNELEKYFPYLSQITWMLNKNNEKQFRIHDTYPVKIILHRNTLKELVTFAPHLLKKGIDDLIFNITTWKLNTGSSDDIGSFLTTICKFIEFTKKDAEPAYLSGVFYGLSVILDILYIDKKEVMYEMVFDHHRKDLGILPPYHRRPALQSTDPGYTTEQEMYLWLEMISIMTETEIDHMSFLPSEPEESGQSIFEKVIKVAVAVFRNKGDSILSEMLKQLHGNMDISMISSGDHWKLKNSISNFV